MNPPSGDKRGRLPFFLVAGMFGNVLNLSHLAHLLGEDRPFYALIARLLQSHGRIPNMMAFAELLNHVHFTISYHIAQRDYKNAKSKKAKKSRKATVVKAKENWPPKACSISFLPSQVISQVYFAFA